MPDDTQEVLPADNAAIRNFAQLIASLEGGQLNADATAAMENLVHALNDRMLVNQKAAGAITIKLKLAADRGIIDVTADITTKEPAGPRGRTALYVANARFLTRRDPTQYEMPLRRVDGPAPEIRTAG